MNFLKNLTLPNYIFLFIFICLGIILIFLPFLADNFFIVDDFDWLSYAHSVTSLKDVVKINWGFIYNPGINTYFFAVYKLFALNPIGYYLVNIIMHAANAFLIFYLVNIFLKNKYLSFFLGLFYLFQYFGAESYFLINAATHLTATFFILSSLIFVYHFARTKKLLYLILFVPTTILAITSKEISYIFPLLLFFWLVLLYKHDLISISKKTILKIFIPTSLIWAIYGTIQFLNLRQSHSLDYFFNPTLSDQLQAIINSFGVLFFYNLDISLNILVLIGLIIFAIILIFGLRKNSYLLFFGFLWIISYLIYLSFSVSSLIASTGTQALIPLRYGYVTTIGVIFILCALFYKFRSSIAKISLVVVLTGFMVYNFFGIIDFENRYYQVMTDISRGVTNTLPNNIKTVDTIYVLDGYPYDPHNYLYEMLDVYYNIEKEKIRLIYTDNRNNQSIDEGLENYVVIKFDYDKLEWETLQTK